MSKLSQSLCFDLTNTFSGYPKLLSYFFQGTLPAIFKVSQNSFQVN